MGSHAIFRNAGADTLRRDRANRGHPLVVPMKLGESVVAVRHLHCENCAAKCDAYRASAIAFDDPCTKCPAGWWPEWDCTGTPVAASPPSGWKGLGDLVHAVAQPVVAAVKAATGGRVDLN